MLLRRWPWIVLLLGMLPALAVAEDDVFQRGLDALERTDYEKAIEHFSAVVRRNPRNVRAYNNRGVAYQQEGYLDKAIADYTAAIRTDSRYGRAYANRGSAFFAQKDYDRAVADYTQALRIDAGQATAYFGRGAAYRKKRDFPKASADYRAAIRINPKYVDAYNNLAWLCATCPDARVRSGKEALEYAKRACELTGRKVPICLDTLAAAYAELGDFAKAIRCQEEMLKLDDLSSEEKAEAGRRLKLYRNHKPFREE